MLGDVPLDPILPAGSCSEGKKAVSVDVRRQARFLDWLGQQVDATPKNFTDPTLERRQPEQVHVSGRIELDSKVDIASCLGIATGEGAEQGESTDPALT